MRPIDRKLGRSVFADWLETVAISNLGKPVARHMARDLGAAHFGLSDELVLDAFSEAASRANTIPGYPFDCGNDFIVSLPESLSSTYVACLLLSPNNSVREIDEWHLNSAASVFESIAEFALGGFFGDTTEVVNFGYPSSQGRPEFFDDAVKWLASKSGLRIGNSYRPPRKKDGGVDLFVWKKFNDNRRGIPVLMVQCTIGSEYLLKVGDIDVALWSSWLSTDLNPLVGLAFPGMIDSSGELEEITSRALCLDRPRIVELAHGRDLELPQSQSRFIANLAKGFAEAIN